MVNRNQNVAESEVARDLVDKIAGTTRDKERRDGRAAKYAFCD
jgi:hypothetical protein